MPDCSRRGHEPLDSGNPAPLSLSLGRRPGCGKPSNWSRGWSGCCSMRPGEARNPSPCTGAFGNRRGWCQLGSPSAGMRYGGARPTCRRHLPEHTVSALVRACCPYRQDSERGGDGLADTAHALRVRADILEESRLRMQAEVVRRIAGEMEALQTLNKPEPRADKDARDRGKQDRESRIMALYPRLAFVPGRRACIPPGRSAEGMKRC